MLISKSKTKIFKKLFARKQQNSKEKWTKIN